MSVFTVAEQTPQYEEWDGSMDDNEDGDYILTRPDSLITTRGQSEHSVDEQELSRQGSDFSLTDGIIPPLSLSRRTTSLAQVEQEDGFLVVTARETEK